MVAVNRTVMYKCEEQELKTKISVFYTGLSTIVNIPFTSSIIYWNPTRPDLVRNFPTAKLLPSGHSGLLYTSYSLTNQLRIFLKYSSLVLKSPKTLRRPSAKKSRQEINATAKTLRMRKLIAARARGKVLDVGEYLRKYGNQRTADFSLRKAMKKRRLSICSSPSLPPSLPPSLSPSLPPSLPPSLTYSLSWPAVILSNEGCYKPSKHHYTPSWSMACVCT